MRDKTISEFNEMLASRSPVPGGGSVSALAGALGAGLGVMVGCLTEGKKNSPSAESKLKALTAEVCSLQKRLLALIEEDAENFAPLSKIYAMPKNAPDRAEKMEQCLLQAAQAPMEIARASCRAIELMEKLRELASELAVSDAGCGAIVCKAALETAALNVYANTRFMRDRAAAEKMNGEVAEMVKKYAPLADGTYRETKNILLQNAKF